MKVGDIVGIDNGWDPEEVGVVVGSGGEESVIVKTIEGNVPIQTDKLTVIQITPEMYSKAWKLSEELGAAKQAAQAKFVELDARHSVARRNVHLMGELLLDTFVK